MTHLSKSIRIHAPLKAVYDVAHDREHWEDWYVGLSEEKDLRAEGVRCKHRYLMVGTPFPLTQKVLEDHLGTDEALWRAKSDGDTECAEVARCCRLLLLASDQSWTYTEKDLDTEVTVEMDYSLPLALLERGCDPAIVEQLEVNCLERSLANLKRLCEVSH
jgi:hypothetical protein